MRVKVLYLGLVRDMVGKREEEYQIKAGSTLLDLFEALAGTYGEGLNTMLKANKESRLDPTFIATVNGTMRDPHRAKDVLLSDGDTVALMTLISGG